MRLVKLQQPLARLTVAALVTLIDLPGITHISDDPLSNIHTDTTDLVRKYISPSDMIVLVVVPATDDFHNTEAIKLAREVDPDGQRTLGVVTKSDQCPEDTDLLAKLRMDGRQHGARVARLGTGGCSCAGCELHRTHACEFSPPQCA